MKRYPILLLLTFLVIFSCGNPESGIRESLLDNIRFQRMKFHIEKDFLPTLSEDASDTIMEDSIASMLQSLNMRMVPYNDVAEIKKEFSTIKDYINKGYEYNINALLEKYLINRMEFHLSNPVTYQNWGPCDEYTPFKVLVSSDGKYKFYTTWNISEGTMGHWVTWYQYIGDDGKLACRQWQGDRRFDCQGNVVDIWQFNHNDTSFYVLKSVWQSSSCNWGYSMEIVTFTNGVPTYHIRFFPDMKEYGEIKKLYFEDGELCESDWVKEDGAYTVCSTTYAKDVDYTFDPRTLIVKARTQDGKSGKLITETWKLKTR